MGWRHDYTLTIANVANAYLTGNLVVPPRGVIKRARADIQAGGSGTQIALQFRIAAGAPGVFDVALGYALTADPLDSDEEAGIYYEIPNPTGLPWLNAQIAVLTDSAVADNDIDILFNIDAPAENVDGMGVI